MMKYSNNELANYSLGDLSETRPSAINSSYNYVRVTKSHRPSLSGVCRCTSESAWNDVAVPAHLERTIGVQSGE